MMTKRKDSMGMLDAEQILFRIFATIGALLSVYCGVA
jgi:hypothetical protein